MTARVRGVPSGRVSFHTERGTVHPAALPPGGAGTVAWETPSDEAGFVRAAVRDQHGSVAALTNPIVLASGR